MAGLILSPAFAIAHTLCDLERPAPGCDIATLDRTLHMNQLQAIGTHNSYKQAMPPDEWAAHHSRDPRGAEGLDYAHPALDVQLDRGARTLELDIYHDPQGGRYAHPPGALRKGYAPSPWPAAIAADMDKPGFKVMHLADIDFRSSCQVFVDCLKIIRRWSLAHPRHVPIMLLLNAKDGHGGPGAADPLPFTAAAFDAMDAEIRSVFAPNELVVPDDVQGKRSTLREAVLAGQWPTLGGARGKVFFVLDEDRAKVAMYRGTRHSLEGRVAFVNTDETSPAAAYLTLNDPLVEGERIRRDVDAGYMVRTRADADTREARRDDTSRRDAAFASGAQYVSTDYMVPDARFGPYRVTLPDAAVARCTPRLNAAACSPQGHP
ncbi:phosphatidylinositol-specific phospholipase C1-like protein [Dyella jiangningensis]|uniref:phosphatidylinositol-specific phospholipase C1-like protein n=1 Tax=Dyella jiangningensis TaxID=1379159 RepID=UPI00240FEFA6|nr:phosphatidylinositol-specific phospholipase C1-like protein [Dyella jiangningensis]MDG2536612.1 phosphatidylinositol-specific phospholipase C1-like protein [Dyella jiangningensis]